MLSAWICTESSTAAKRAQSKGRGVLGCLLTCSQLFSQSDRLPPDFFFPTSACFQGYPNPLATRGIAIPATTRWCQEKERGRNRVRKRRAPAPPAVPCHPKAWPWGEGQPPGMDSLQLKISQPMTVGRHRPGWGVFGTSR